MERAMGKKKKKTNPRKHGDVLSKRKPKNFAKNLFTTLRVEMIH